MGGWGCAKREGCRLYHNNKAQSIAERLCDRGRFDSFEPVRIVRAPGTWERQSAVGLLQPAAWADPVAA